MVIYEKRVYNFILEIVDKGTVVASGEIVLKQENDYNFGEDSEEIVIESYKNQQLPDVTVVDVEMFLEENDLEELGVSDLATDEKIVIEKDTILHYINE